MKSKFDRKCLTDRITLNVNEVRTLIDCWKILFDIIDKVVTIADETNCEEQDLNIYIDDFLYEYDEIVQAAEIIEHLKEPEDIRIECND